MDLALPALILPAVAFFVAHSCFARQFSQTANGRIGVFKALAILLDVSSPPPSAVPKELNVAELRAKSWVTALSAVTFSIGAITYGVSSGPAIRLGSICVVFACGAVVLGTMWGIGLVEAAWLIICPIAWGPPKRGTRQKRHLALARGAVYASVLFICVSAMFATTG